MAGPYHAPPCAPRSPARPLPDSPYIPAPMRSAALVAASILLLAACSGDGATTPSTGLVMAARLRSPAVDSGGTVVVSLTASNPGSRSVRVTAPSSCVATARIVDSRGATVATPTILCAPVLTHYQFAPGDTSQWDVGLDVRSAPGAYRVIASLTLGTTASLEDTLPLTIQ